MSHRQSCDRCRQQKVRCFRDDAQRVEGNLFSPGRPSLSPCERCMKAGVDCVYSLTSNQRPSRRSVQTSVQRDTDLGPSNPSGTPWFDQNLGGPLYPAGSSLGADFVDLVGQFSGIDENGTFAGFNGWDAKPQSFSPTSLGSFIASPAAEVNSNSTDSRDGSEDVVDGKDFSDSLSSQLTCLSQRSAQAIRRLVGSRSAPLMVSSPEVNEALEDTNTLVRIINNMTASDPDATTLNQNIVHALAFSALACHQHLIALFQAIFDAINRCFQSQKDQQLHHNRSRQRSDVGPSSVAQFVMVLQLLIHLINRMDRSLFQYSQANSHDARLSSGSNAVPVTPNTSEQPEAVPASSSPPGGILVLVQDIVGTIPDEHEKLRQVIQRLQREMEHSELY